MAVEQLDGQHRQMYGVEPQTVGGDKHYHNAAFVRACRDRQIKPHTALKKETQVEGLDGRTPRRSRGTRSARRVRKRAEEIFGWMKTVGGFRRSRYRGTDRTQAWAYFVASAYNLVRMAKLEVVLASG